MTLDDEARATRTAHLKTAATAARLTDPELLRIARADLSAEASVAELKARYPSAFEAEPVKQFRDMTVAERVAFQRQHGIVVRAGR